MATITSTTDLAQFVGPRVRVVREHRGVAQIFEGRFESLRHRGDDWAGGMFCGDKPQCSTGLAVPYGAEVTVIE